MLTARCGFEADPAAQEFRRVLRDGSLRERSSEASENVLVDVARHDESPVICHCKSEHVLHRVQAGRTADEPARRPHRAAGESEPVAGAMRQLDALAGAGERHGVVADDVAAAKHRKADRARARGAPVAVACVFGRRRSASRRAPAPPLRRARAPCPRARPSCCGGGLRRPRCRSSASSFRCSQLSQLQQQVHAEAHVRRHDDRRCRCAAAAICARCASSCPVVPMTSGTLRRDAGREIGGGRLGQREIDGDVAPLHRAADRLRSRHARRTADGFAGILPSQRLSADAVAPLSCIRDFVDGGAATARPMRPLTPKIATCSCRAIAARSAAHRFEEALHAVQPGCCSRGL